MKIEQEYLTEEELQEIKRLLTFSKHNPPELEDIWNIMDRVWDELGCDNVNFNPETVAAFYEHPLWTLNGIFIENHDESLKHRNAISTWIIEHELKSVLDFGGGLGTLARMIADKNPSIKVDIYEPFPSRYAICKNESYTNVNFVKSLDEKYDCLISTDVLEHVPDPLKLLNQMIDCVQIDGFLILANHFYPSIKCHLPSTFHFRDTFDQFTRQMGLEKIESVKNCGHAIVYRKVRSQKINWLKLRLLEKKSQLRFALKQIKYKYFVNKKL